MTLWKLPSEIPLIVRLAPTLWRASNLKRSSGAWSHSIISGHFHNQSVDKNMETPSVTTFRNSAKGFTEHKNIWQHWTHSAPASGFCHCICNFCSARDFVLKTSNIPQHLLTQQSSWGEGLGICNFNCVGKPVMLTRHVPAFSRLWWKHPLGLLEQRERYFERPWTKRTNFRWSHQVAFTFGNVVKVTVRDILSYSSSWLPTVHLLTTSRSPWGFEFLGSE